MIAALIMSDIFKLQRVIGYQFSDPSLLVEALTHSSYHGKARGTDNERLEFLGDRVLGIMVADELFKRFPFDKEGALARRYNTLICRPTCAAIAREIKLGDHLRLGRSEQPTGAGQVKSALLANACEALLGALYLDGGTEAIRPLFDRHWLPRFEETSGIRRDSKTALQEWAQGLGLPLPRYDVVDQTGPDHAPAFVIAVSVEGYEAVSAQGSSKRKGEQAAATAFMERHSLKQEEEE